MGMDILSPFSFYGGKAKMSSLICDMLDYDNTDIYVEPFGGACRVLLNKPRHKVEIYNDFGIGLYEFFYTMSDPRLSREVISALYDITPSKELFYEMKEYKTKRENDVMDYMQLQFKELAYALVKKYNSKDLKQLHSLIIKQEYATIIETAKDILKKGIIQDEWDIKAFTEQISLYENYWEFVKDEYNEVYEEAQEAFEQKWEEKEAEGIEITVNKKNYIYAKSHEIALDTIRDYTSDILISNSGEVTMSDVDMAVASFVTYYLSRDGMGKDYSETKGNSLESYYRQIAKLEDVADRFKGVIVNQVDAMWLIAAYCQAKNAMLYLDPSYLKITKSKKKSGKNNKKDLGKGIYNRSFDYEKHEDLARMIQDEKAHIILSNYDVAPYNELLTEEHGWKRIEFETTTGVGGKKNNERTEVLWYNY